MLNKTQRELNCNLMDYDEDWELVQAIGDYEETVKELESVLSKILTEFDSMVWGEDYEYVDASQRVIKMVEDTLMLLNQK